MKNGDKFLADVLRISSDEFQEQKLQNIDILASRIANVLKNDSDLNKKFFQNLIYNKIERTLLLNFFPEKNSINPREPIDNLFPGNQEAQERLRTVERETGLSLPDKVISKQALIVLFLLFSILTATITYFFIMNAALFSAFPSLLLWPFIVVTIGFPVTIFYILFPNFLARRNFYNIKTFDQFTKTAIHYNWDFVDKVNNEFLEKAIIAELIN